MRSTDLHRFLLCGICFFLDMKTREHDLFSRRLFSPTNYINYTPLFSLKRLFLPQIVQITRILFFFFFDSLFDCVKCALRICTDFCLAAIVFVGGFDILNCGGLSKNLGKVLFCRGWLLRLYSLIIKLLFVLFR